MRQKALLLQFGIFDWGGACILTGNKLNGNLINALCHRDYSIRGGSIAVAFYDDRVNITSTGFLPQGITIKQLPKEHPSVRRNHLIANIFYLCHMIERWGPWNERHG